MLMSGPAVEPVSVAQAKAWLRVDGGAEDELLASLILSARLALEAHTRRRFVTQNWRVTLDAWPQTTAGALPPVAIPLAPFQRITGVRVYDAANIARQISADVYLAPPAMDHARVIFLAAPPTPGRSFDGIEIDIAAGYGDQASDTPEPLRCALLMLAAYWHENRGDAPATGADIPADVRALAAPFLRRRLT
jgi:uncharacterized phiE125 gp8 family phage protein